MDIPVVQTTNLTKIYNSGDSEVIALNNVTLRIEKGSFISIMGPSGSGKSTLLNILGGLDKPTSGKYFLEDQDMSDLNSNELALVRSTRIGIVFQSFNLLPKLSAIQNVILPLKHTASVRSEREYRAASAILSVGLDETYFDRRISELSGGQAQRIAIARAIVNNPPLLLADEPTGNLDSASSSLIMGVLSNLHQKGITIVLITHGSHAASYSDKTVTLEDGLILGDLHENS